MHGRLTESDVLSTDHFFDCLASNYLQLYYTLVPLCPLGPWGNNVYRIFVALCHFADRGASDDPQPETFA